MHVKRVRVYDAHVALPTENEVRPSERQSFATQREKSTFSHANLRLVRLVDKLLALALHHLLPTKDRMTTNYLRIISSNLDMYMFTE